MGLFSNIKSNYALKKTIQHANMGNFEEALSCIETSIEFQTDARVVPVLKAWYNLLKAIKYSNKNDMLVARGALSKFNDYTEELMLFYNNTSGGTRVRFLLYSNEIADFFVKNNESINRIK